MKRVITGLQPTGVLTIGNYIGSIMQMVKYQKEYETFIFIADMHAITIPQNPLELKNTIRSLVALYLASGINPNECTIFIQSENIYHANDSWILECLTPYGELTRMTQFKDKSSKNVNFNAGLLTYPVLMAADILLYDADYVPTGKDQKQHVELARNIAERINKKYQTELFKLPEPLIKETGAKIMDLVDPTKKMNKSSDNPKGIIYMLDKEEDIRKKIMSATTDSEMVIKYDMESKPGISNLINLYASLSGMSITDVENKFKDANYGTFKQEVADQVIKTLKPIQDKYYQYLNDNTLDDILDKGIKKAQEIAKEKYLMLKNTIGLGR